MTLFSDLPTVRYEGEGSSNPLAYRYYDPDKIVLGKTMKEQLRLTVCYWHSFVMNGGDPFGAPTIDRPWMHAGNDPLAAARAKADAAFDLFRVLDVPLYSFHDRDVAPEGDGLAATLKNTREIGEYLGKKQQETGVKLLWGTANLFSHPRFMAGASTNPDPDVFAWSAATVKTALDVTHELGGANYVMWGGREGYETLLNTDLKRELDQMGRFLSLVVEYKHKIGFSGPILIEPKPKEPTKHQYDFDAATVYGFLKHYGLEKDVKLNLEENHAILAGHTFEHEIAVANAFGILGSLDINRGDPLLGWDTDQFPNDVPQLTLALYEVLKGGGLTTGGLNFDAKIRRQSIEVDDLVHAHVGGIDVCAKAFLAAAKMVETGALAKHVGERYAGWDKAGHAAGGATLDEIAAAAEARGISPKPRSGRQEMLENLVSRSV
ncbi:MULTISPECIES: xylose isomerase [Lichenihabitans]|uniref:xylose isomerase n=1 Tax=Lichenihabitans TaxID=2723776 RepID=UPI001035A652|nr:MULTISPECIES: xylose isomerase [Lichenihabitans]UDL93708.1 xylose isomerase [Lichenihabitans sp. PAMC28606]